MSQQVIYDGHECRRRWTRMSTERMDSRSKYRAFWLGLSDFVGFPVMKWKTKQYHPAVNGEFSLHNVEETQWQTRGVIGFSRKKGGHERRCLRKHPTSLKETN